MATSSFPAIRDQVLSALISGDMDALEDALFQDEETAPASALASVLIMEAIQHENWAGAHLLIKLGAEINGHDRQGRSALHHCARAKDCANAALLGRVILEAKGNANHRDNSAIMPLSEAAQAGNLDLVDALFAHGAHLNGNHLTAFQLMERALASPQAGAMLDKLAQHGVPLTARGMSGGTILHSAAAMGSLSAIARLLDQGLDACAIDAANLQPLHWLGRDIPQDRDPADVARRCADAITLLTSKGASVNAGGPQGMAPLHKAVERQHGPLIIGALLDAGAEIDLRNYEYETPLHLAANLSRGPSVETLLRRGANADLEDYNDKRAEDRARPGVIADLLKSWRELGALEQHVAPGGAPGRRRMQ